MNTVGNLVDLSLNAVTDCLYSSLLVHHKEDSIEFGVFCGSNGVVSFSAVYRVNTLLCSGY